MRTAARWALITKILWTIIRAKATKWTFNAITKLNHRWIKWMRMRTRKCFWSRRCRIPRMLISPRKLFNLILTMPASKTHKSMTNIITCSKIVVWTSLRLRSTRCLLISMLWYRRVLLVVELTHNQPHRWQKPIRRRTSSSKVPNHRKTFPTSGCTNSKRYSSLRRVFHSTILKDRLSSATSRLSSVFYASWLRPKSTWLTRRRTPSWIRLTWTDMQTWSRSSIRGFDWYSAAPISLTAT